MIAVLLKEIGKTKLEEHYYTILNGKLSRTLNTISLRSFYSPLDKFLEPNERQYPKI